MKGSASHKTVDQSSNPFLQIYYTSELVLFVMSVGNDLFFCLLYLHDHIQEPAAWFYWLQGVCGIICLLKTAFSLVHLFVGVKNMAAIDNAKREVNRKTQLEKEKERQE
ncbi:CDP-diacylglycerol--inositol 3-phosphatidyltransferase-like [Plectropomus leopardus]|uniref:CDP-diacylglycerol--inositol 3-phosphatidyltransferase-like n=1 Tax=Plectropomus leopardus TaxID=160734 RepID=UPI001C4BAE35|nr:CDP-diacylglycerol--inositol 3-phosphatidyltransferase-like [Plectropomus leopardus]